VTKQIKQLTIDFVSDVSCPWCAIGLNALRQALAELDGEIGAELQFQPFELNPAMPAGGQDVGEHLAEKYRMTPEQLAQSQEMIRARGAEVGFTFNMDRRRRIYNTFDAHRLLHWAALEGRQLELKSALFQSYFGAGDDPGAHDVLVRLAAQAGLDAERARQVLESDAYAAEVRAAERHYQEQGIHSVPAVIVNGRYLIQGGQPAEVFARSLRQIAAESDAQGVPA